MDALAGIYRTIVGWSRYPDGWFANQTQLVLGMHLIQQFMVQHMLTREHPDQWADWWPAPQQPPTAEVPQTEEPPSADG